MLTNLLAQVPIFRGLPESELEYLAKSLRVREVLPDTILFREGEAGDHFYIVIDGQIEVLKAMDTDNEQLIGLREAGDFIGEMSLMNRQGMRTASVRSRGLTHLWEMSRGEFDELLQRQPAMAYEMLSVLSERLTYAHNASIRDLQEKNQRLKEAYDALKKAQAQIIEKEKLERELQLATEIQMGILPQTLPVDARFDFGARISPARAVGGDFYDFFQLSPHKTGIVIGDVADKGIPSAIFMAQTHALVYAEAHQSDSPGQVLRRVNEHLLSIGEARLFVTVLYGVLDMEKGNFSYARAGHELPLIVENLNAARLMPQKQGQLLGLLPAPVLDEQALLLSERGYLLLYTDGVLDARDPTEEAFGMERLFACLPFDAHLSAQGICDCIWQAVNAHRGTAPQYDDITMVCVRRKR